MENTVSSWIWIVVTLPNPKNNKELYNKYL